MPMGAMHSGTGAVGQLLANSTVMVEDGTISANCLEALGFSLSEMGDMGAGLMMLAASCRHETADYTPPVVRR
jgi:hypothetical protein